MVRWMVLALALSGCFMKRPNHVMAYAVDGVMVGVGGAALIAWSGDSPGGDDPGAGPLDYIAGGLIVAGLVGAAVTYIMDMQPEPDPVGTDLE